MRKFEMISYTQIYKDVDENVKFEPVIPKRATKESAGYDFFAPYTIILRPNTQIKIPTGIKVHMNPGEVLMVYPRSGLGFKYYCRLANTVGVIDSDYINSDNEGHIWVKLRNEGIITMTINAGEAMCQGIFIPFLITDDDTLENGKVRNGGFGSTNKLT